MQQKKMIDNNININLLTFWNIFLWIIPVTKFFKKGDEEHNKLSRKVNYSLVGMAITLIVSLILMNR
jgi:hypothetical protein